MKSRPVHALDKSPAPTYYSTVMASERIQRRIDRLLDQAEEAMDRSDWESVRDHAKVALGLDPENTDALAFVASVEQVLEAEPTLPSSPATGGPPAAPVPNPVQPTSFVNGRYEVRKFLGEGGKKRVYLAQDTLLDREVAFALIKTEGLDDAARVRITREALAKASRRTYGL